MNNRPTPIRELLIPILLGGFSLVGIVAVLIIGRALSAPAEIAATPSATPFQYIYLGTEPAITTLVADESELAPPTEPPATEAPVFDTPTRRPFSTPVILGSRTATSRATTPTKTNTPLVANTYDDTDTRLSYSGSWSSETVSGAYQGTLHISSNAGNSLSFTFTGTQIHFFYQAGQSLGTVTIFIDGDTLGTAVNESRGGEWVQELDSGTHTIVIRHTGGGSVNIDRLMIPAATPIP